MKRILLTTTAVFAFAGMAHAQQADATAQAADASVTSSAFFGLLTETDNAAATVSGESAVANIETTGFLGGITRSRAEVGNSVVASAEGNGNNASDTGSATTGANVANAGVQFQVGNYNSSINMQVGTYQESAMVQIGNTNAGLISQDGSANEAAISQVGDDNTSALVQEDQDNAAAAAAYGNDNTAIGLQQSGPQNILAMAQQGNSNSASIFQDGDTNTAVSLQIGDDNASFISQGGGTSFVAEAINGDLFNGGIAGRDQQLCCQPSTRKWQRERHSSDWHRKRGHQLPKQPLIWQIKLGHFGGSKSGGGYAPISNLGGDS